MIVGYYKNYLYTTDISSALKKKKKESQHMVSHPETGSDSPIGSDQDRGRDRRLDDERCGLERSNCTIIFLGLVLNLWFIKLNYSANL